MNWKALSDFVDELKLRKGVTNVTIEEALARVTEGIGDVDALLDKLTEHRLMDLDAEDEAELKQLLPLVDSMALLLQADDVKQAAHELFNTAILVTRMAYALGKRQGMKLPRQ